MMPSSEKKGVLCLGVAVLCFASVPLFLKYFTAFLDAWTVNGIRYGMTALLWLPFTIRNRRSKARGCSVWRAALAPAVVNTLAQVGWALAPYHNDAGFIGFVIRSSFLFGIVFGFWLLPEERVLARRVLFWFGAAAIVGGLVAMYGGGVRGGGTSAVGMAILLATALCWGLYATFVRRHMADFGARLSFGVISLYTAVMLGAAMFLFGRWRQAVALAPGNWALLVTSALIGIAVSHVLLYRAIHSLGPVVTQGVQSFSPFLTALGACLILGERLTGGQWVAGCLLAAGCLFLVWLKFRPKPAT